MVRMKEKRRVGEKKRGGLKNKDEDEYEKEIKKERRWRLRGKMWVGIKEEGKG